MSKTAVLPDLKEVAAEQGALAAASGRFVEAVSRDEVLTTHGGGDLALYAKLLDDDQVFATFKQRRDAVVARETKVDPGGDDQASRDAADFLRENLQRLAWDRTCFQMLAALMYGRGIGEVMYGYDKRLRVTIEEIRVRRAARFKFDVGGRLYLQREGAEPVLMPDRKFWRFTCGADDADDPYGRGLGHNLYWLVWFKRNIIRFWSLFLERFAQPLPKATAPAGAGKEEIAKLLGMLKAFVNGGELVVPRGVEVELIQALKDSGGDYDRFLLRMDAAITKIILTQTMTTENGSSLSQAEVHERVGQQGAKSDSDLLTESFCAGPARWLTEMNFPGAKTPIVYRDFSVTRDLSAAADRDSKLAQMGYRPTLERVREVYGDGYELAPVSTAAAAPASFAEGTPKIRDASEAVEDLLKGDGWRRILGPEVDRIDALLGDARSLEDVRERIGELALADPDRLVDGLSRVMFAARVQGNAGGAEGSDEG